MVTSLRARARQRRHPKEFRIEAPAWPREALAYLEALAERTSQSQVDALDARLLAKLGTRLWRLRQKVLGSDGDVPRDGMRPVHRHVQSAWSALTEAGLDVQDHAGTRFDAGLALKVVAFQPTPGIQEEQVLETLRPSIYHNGDLIQMGEVIVGTPSDEVAK